MTDTHPIVILDDDDDDVEALTVYQHQYGGLGQESTSLTSLPPAFNPEFVGASVAAGNTTTKAAPAMAPVQIQTAEDLNRHAVNKTTTTASSPVPAQTVDPFIAAVFQHGFNDDHGKEVIVIDDNDNDEEGDSDFSPRSCLDERIMTARTLVSPNDRLEKRFVQEPRRTADASSTTASADDMTTATTAASTMVESIATSSSASSSSSMPSACSAAFVPALVPAVTGHVPPGTKANPPSAPRYIPLTQHQSHYDRLRPYAQMLAWRTQLHTRAALERGLRLRQKHAPLVRRVVKKSFKAIRKVSKKSTELAVHYGPIVGRRMKRASIRTFEDIKEMEANHQILAKSKENIHNAWSRQRGTRASF